MKAKQQLNIIQIGLPLNGSYTLVHLFSGASTWHGLSLSSARFAILLSGFGAFVALTEVSQGGLLNKVFSPWTDGPTCVVQLEIGLLRVEPRASENGPYFSEISLGVTKVVLSEPLFLTEGWMLLSESWFVLKHIYYLLIYLFNYFVI